MQQEQQDFEHIIGTAIMDDRYGLSLADESIYSYLGVKVVSMLTAHIHPDDRKLFVDTVNDVRENEEKFVLIRLKNFTEQYANVIVFIKRNEIDPEKFYDLSIYDIVYLVQKYNNLNEAHKKVTMAMQLMSPVSVFDYNMKTGRIMVMNTRDEVSFEGPIDDLYNTMVENAMIDKMHISGVHKLVGAIKKGTSNISSVFNMKVSSKLKKLSPMTIRTSVLYDKNTSAASYVVGVVLPEEEESIGTAEKLYSDRSNLDPLTGLYNKAAIKEMAIDALTNATQTINYVMLDLDHFKEVNDTYGHMFGDEVILNVARIIKDVVGKRGFVGRVGGDEFFIVLKGIGDDLDALRPVLRSLRSQIEWAYKGKLGNIRLTPSIGCASYPKDAENYDDLFKLADRCLYIAKTKGRNRFIIYTPSMHGSLEDIKAADNSIKMERALSDIQRLEFVSDAVTRLCDWKTSVINPVLKDMLKYFGANELAVYEIASGKAIYYSDPALDTEEENICNHFDEFKTVFRETNIFAYGDSINLKVPYPDFYEYMQKAEYFSFVAYSIKNKGDITHLAVAYRKGAYEKWSDMTLNMLSILFKTIGDKIIEETNR